MENKPITTIIFDLGGVLFRGFSQSAGLLAAVLPIPPEVIREQYRQGDLAGFMLGRVTEAEYWTNLSRRFGWNIPPEVPMRLVREYFQEIGGVRPQIVDLRRRGYTLAALSNHTREWVDYLQQRYPYEHLFDRCLYSFHLDARKPEREIFIRALRTLDATPDTTLLIDDGAQNLLAARELGMHVLQCLTPHQLAVDLRQRLPAA